MHILSLFKEQRKLSFEEIKELTEQSKTVLKDQLQQQIKKRRLIKDGDNYVLKPIFKIGVVDLKERFGFLLQKEKDLYIDFKDFNSALNGDLVLVREGNQNKILEVLERNTTKLVCTVKKISKKFYLFPKKNVRLPIELRDYSNLIDGEVVYVKLLNYYDNFIEGEIVERIGHITDPDIDILNIVYQYNFPYHFAKETIEEAENINSEVDANSRTIVENEYIVTIDGEDAKDLDDAISLKMINDNYHLSIHIADVSYYVKKGGFIDKEAYERGTSAYLADRVIPMLPRRLSNDLCSLNVGENKYALSVFLTLDKSGEVINYEVKETIISVNRRLSYNEVNNFFAGGSLKDKNLEIMLNKMLDLSNLLAQKRYKRGALNFESEEYNYILSSDNKIVDIVLREQGISEKIIESFMILTNEVIGEHLAHLNLPNIYRIHPKPTLEKLNQLFVELEPYDINKPKHKSITPKTLQLLLKEVEESPLKYIINDLMLRAMNKAKYSINNEGHFGLASRYYSHFTAPIRRYPDLLLHRLVKDYLLESKDLNKKIKYYEKTIPAIAEHTSKMEKVAEIIEREVDKYKITEFMETKLNETFEGIITGFINAGFFVKINKGIEGMVPYRLETNVNYNNEIPIYANKEVLKMGSLVKVKLVEANKELRQITFVLA